MIIVGLYREALGGRLPRKRALAPRHGPGRRRHRTGCSPSGAIFILARSFANGGSSLTGIEAVSNAVSAFTPARGPINARQILVTQGSIVAFLIAGISWLAHITHAVPYVQRRPDGGLPGSQPGLRAIRAATCCSSWSRRGRISILFTGGNTSFNGFPFLTSFVAEDSFLPRWLTKRGHRLVFSNGIIVLTVLALTLLLVVGANVNALVPFYAIGVFTGFSMAGFGMARYHQRTQGAGLAPPARDQLHGRGATRRSSW